MWLRIRLPGDGTTPRAFVISATGHALLMLMILLRRAPSASLVIPGVRLVASGPSAPPARARPPEPPRPTPPEPEPEPEPETPTPPPEPIGVAPHDRSPRKQPPKPKRKPPPPKPQPPPPEAPVAGPVGPVASEGIAASVEGGFGDDVYLQALVRKVSHSWLKPTTGLPAAPAIVYFELSSRGAVSAIRLESSSGALLYDRSALRAIELSAPLPPVPPAYDVDVLKVHFHFLP